MSRISCASRRLESSTQPLIKDQVHQPQYAATGAGEQLQDLEADAAHHEAVDAQGAEQNRKDEDLVPVLLLRGEPAVEQDLPLL